MTTTTILVSLQGGPLDGGRLEVPIGTLAAAAGVDGIVIPLPELLSPADRQAAELLDYDPRLELLLLQAGAFACYALDGAADGVTIWIHVPVRK